MTKDIDMDSFRARLAKYSQPDKSDQRLGCVYAS